MSATQGDLVMIHLTHGKPLVWDAEHACRLRQTHRIVGCLSGCLARQPRQNHQLSLPLQLLPEEVSLLLSKGLALLLKQMSVVTRPTERRVNEFEERRKTLYAQQVALSREMRERDMAARRDAIREAKERKWGPTANTEGDDLDIGPLPESSAAVQIRTATPLEDDRLGPAEWNFPTTELERLRLTVFCDLWQKGHFLTSGTKFGGDFLVYPGDPSRYHSFYVAICLPSGQSLKGHDLIAMGRLSTNVKKTVVLCSLDEDSKPSYLSLEWTGFS